MLKLNTEQFVKNAIDKYGDKFNYEKVNYTKSNIKINLFCNTCKNNFLITPNSHLNSKTGGCSFCKSKLLSKKFSMSNEDFIEKSKIMHGDRFYYLSEYKNNRTKIQLKCKICKINFEQTPNSHYKTKGCIKCNFKARGSLNKKFTIVEFENKAKNRFSNNYTYYQDYINNGEKIKITCKKHKCTYKQSPNNHLNGKRGCRKCRKVSRGELSILRFLYEKEVKFEYQKCFVGCVYKKQLSYDFYIPHIDTCIEFDGRQHYEPIQRWGGEESFKLTQIRDKIKNDFCKANKIKLIRIKFDQIKKINSILKKLLDL